MLSRTFKSVVKRGTFKKVLVTIPHQSLIRTLSQSASIKNTTPWYLNPEESSLSSSPLTQVEIPTLPDNHPETLENLVLYLANDLGLVDIKIFDMRNKSTDDSTEGAYDISDFMVIGTGKSTKHIQKASSELDFYIKHNLHKLPITEGILKSGKLAKYHRRLQRKGKTAPNYSIYDYGSSPNTWVMTDTKTDGIIIHMLTSDRRKDLNLEYLWADPAEKHLYKKSSRRVLSDDIFSGIRYFHTSRVTKFDKFELTNENYTNHFNVLMKNHKVDRSTTPLSKLKEHLDLMYASGFSMDFDTLYNYFKTVVESEEFDIGADNLVYLFIKREKFLYRLIQNYNIQLTDEQILKLIPLLIIGSSQFSNPSFVTLKKVMESPDLKITDTLIHSKTLPQIEVFSRMITNSVLDEHRDLKRNIDLLLLSVYANRSNWQHFFRVVKTALNRNDLHVVRAALILVSASDDVKIVSKFEQEYLPIIAVAGIPEELKSHAEKVYKIANGA